MPRKRSKHSKDRRSTNKKFGTRAERKARHAAKKLRRAAQKAKRQNRFTRRIRAGKSITRERSSGQRVKLMMLKEIKTTTKAAPSAGISADSQQGEYTPFTAAMPGKFNIPYGNIKGKIINIGGGGRGAGGGTAGMSGSGPGRTSRAQMPMLDYDSLRNLGRRYAATPKGGAAIKSAKVATGVVAGAVVASAADDLLDVFFQFGGSRMGGGVKTSNTMFSPSVTNAGVGVYFRNKLISLLTDEQYDQFWRNAATHIRKQLKAL